METNKRKAGFPAGLRLSPPQAITASFAAMILLGALLLTLPVASKSGESIGFLDALFTATSANCVTGLVVVNTQQHWTLFGKAVILGLIQLGALGLMTILTLLMVLMRKQISLYDRSIIQASFNLDDIGGMVRLVKGVVRVTFGIEAAGALLLALSFRVSGEGMSWLRALGYGVFHAVSAFCNAGFDIIGTESLMPYRDNIAVNAVIMLLIIAGGLGFPVWIELLGLRQGSHPLRRKLQHLTLHTKLVLLITVLLLFGGAALFLGIEWSNPATLGGLPVFYKWQAALFQSVSMRTAGFNTISQQGLTEISQFVSCILMLIGGSSASTAGGVKTVTVGVILVSMLSVLRGRRRLEAFGRTLPVDLLQKALTVVSTMLIVVSASVLVLHFSEQGSTYPHTFLDLLFETCSAAGTVGVTTGITPHLSAVGKLTLIFCMFLGRLSPVTVVVALNMRLRRGGQDELAYPEERVIIG